jgi:hypothetical protein
VQIEFANVDLAALSFEVESGVGNAEHNERREQQDTPRRRQFLKDGPEEFLGDVQVAPARSKAFGSFGLDVFGIQAIAGAGFIFELRPQLTECQTFSHALPEVPEAHAERHGRGGLSGRGIGSGHGSQDDYMGRSARGMGLSH